MSCFSVFSCWLLVLFSFLLCTKDKLCLREVTIGLTLQVVSSLFSPLISAVHEQSSGHAFFCCCDFHSGVTHPAMFQHQRQLRICETASVFICHVEYFEQNDSLTQLCLSQHAVDRVWFLCFFNSQLLRAGVWSLIMTSKVNVSSRLKMLRHK